MYDRIAHLIVMAVLGNSDGGHNE